MLTSLGCQRCKIDVVFLNVVQIAAGFQQIQTDIQVCCAQLVLRPLSLSVW